MTRALALLVLAAVAAAPRPASAACGNLTNVCTFSQLAACCNLDGATKCKITGPITIANGTCTLDFGTRDVAVQGPNGAIVVGSNSLYLNVGSLAFTANGKLTALGTTTTPGGFVSVTTSGHAQTAFSLDGSIDLSGGGIISGGGTLELHGDGPITLAQDSSITANGIDPAANAVVNAAGGGGVFLETSAGDISVGGAIVARVSKSLTPTPSSGSGGIVQLAAAGDILVRNPHTSGTPSIDVRGGQGQGGSIDLHAGGILTFDYFTIVDASALAKTGGDGGQVLARADGVFKDAQSNLTGLTASGIITVAGGSSGNTEDPGGSGGSIELDATTGPLVVNHGTQGLLLDGASGGYGGSLELHTETPALPAANPPTDGTLTVATPISAQGIGSGLNVAGGGDVTFDSKGTFTLAPASPLVLNSGGDQAGTIEITALRDVIVNSSISASDTSQDADGGTLTVTAGHDVVFNQDLTFDGGPGSCSGSDPIPGGGGGAITAEAGNDMFVKGGKTVSTTGGCDSPGGQIDLSATRNVTVEGNAQVVASAGAAGSTAQAGTVGLVAGAQGTSGNVLVAGSVKANGHASAFDPAHPGQCLNGQHGLIHVEGCQVSITGTINSAGDCGAENDVVVRSQLTTSGGTVRAQNAQNMNAVNRILFKSDHAAGDAPGTHNAPPAATVNLAGGTAVPPFTQTPQDQCVQGHTLNCVFACPTCGDGVTTFPEECDVAGDRCQTHCAHCRLENCAPTNPCALDYCDTLGGCFLGIPLPDGTSCDDGKACTDVDQCTGGQCQHDTHDCNDDNPCTADTCNDAAAPGTDPCGHTPLTESPAPAPCNDGHMCNGFEQCVNGACTPGAPDPCDDGEPTTLDTCNPQTDQCDQLGCSCSHQGVACPNGDADCNHDPCMAGTCVAGNCHFSPAANNTPCSDGDGCTLNDKCQGGVCNPGTPKTCDDAHACTTDSCNSSNGQCVFTPVGNGCCETNADCNDSNVCTTDACTPDHTCAHTEIPSCCTKDADCDDMNVCTGEPGGICALVDPQDPSQGRHCTAHTLLSGSQPGCGEPCNPAQCVTGNGTSTCTPIDPNPAACAPDNDVCTVDYCDAQTGACKHDPIPNCCHNDGECNDQNACTTDACNEANQCDHVTLFAGCTTCTTDVQCDDPNQPDDFPKGRCAGHFCDAGGVCRATTPPSCSDGNITTIDTCTLDANLQPTCVHTCNCADDKNPCNGAETCDLAAKLCVHTGPLDCDDHDACSADSCDATATSAAAACRHDFQTGYDLVTCRLNAVATVVGDTTSGIASGLKKKLGAKLKTVQKALDKAKASHGSKKTQKKLRSALTAFEKYVQTQCNKQKLPSGVCSALSPDLQATDQALGQATI